MLQFVTGRAGSGKTKYLREQIVAQSKTRPNRCIMIVPEQYSFATEKAIIDQAGAKTANVIQVVSFTRLAEMVFRDLGGRAGRRLGEGGRRMLLRMAISSCEDRLSVYAHAARLDRITDVMLMVINELKLCGISPDQLRETGKNMSQELQDKLDELALIYQTYQALVDEAYQDSRDDLTRLVHMIRQTPFFKGYSIAVDAFEGFTVQEILVLEQLLLQADEVCIALCTDNEPESGTGLFALVNRTKRRLKRLARENHVRIHPDIHFAQSQRFRTSSLRELEARLFLLGMSAVSTQQIGQANPEGITLYRADNPYAEAEYIAATIRDLVMRGEYRYRDFTIICRNSNRYAECLDIALKKREIPCFISMPEQIDAEPLLRFVLGAFELVNRGFQTADLMTVLKTGISGFEIEDISLLENYAFLWKLKPADWKNPFYKHPRGFGAQLTQADEEALTQLNRMRERIISPLSLFAQKTAQAAGSQIATAVYDLLCAFQVEENLRMYCDRLTAAGESGLAEKQVRIWNLFIDILDQTATILGQSSVRREKYYTLLKEVIAGEDISEIPQRLDEVIFGTPEQVRQSSPKVVFLVGTVQGEFPLVPKSNGVFSDAERKALIAMHLPLGDPLEQKTIEERYLAYSVACLPAERLYLTYPVSADGEEKSPSELIHSVMDIFPELQVENGTDIRFLANAKEAAFAIMAAKYRDDTPEAAALRGYFKDKAEFSGRMQAIARASGQLHEALEDPQVRKQLFGERMALSATRVDTFYSCKFKFFCRYGIRISERAEAEVNAMQYGTIMHSLFEQVFSIQDFQMLNDMQLRETTSHLVQTYADQNMGGYELLGGKERYRLNRMAISAAQLLRHVINEREQSRFQPEGFELYLGEGRVPALQIDTPEGNKAIVGGAIDRVDIFENENGRFVRVIDYKTGKRDFHLADVLYGLNMQMLVYLTALVVSGYAEPAGILYTPLANPSITVERNASEDIIKKAMTKALKMSGLVLGDAEIISAMEKAAKGEFIPAFISDSGELKGATVPMEQMQVLLLYTKRLIATMVDELYRGNIEAKPAMRRGQTCSYCPYSAVCGREYRGDEEECIQLNEEEAMRIMQEEVEQWQ